MERAVAVLDAASLAEAVAMQTRMLQSSTAVARIAMAFALMMMMMTTTMMIRGHNVR